MSKFDQEKYDQAKNRAQQFFKKNKNIESSCLGTIHFNSEGFLHLIWKKKEKHKRDWKNQIKRFQLLQYVKGIIKGMSHYQEYSENLESVKTKKKGQRISVPKIVKYWAFIAIIEDKIRIKIILKQIGAGNIHFWSVIPSWKTEEYKDIKVVSLHKGNPKED